MGKAHTGSHVGHNCLIVNGLHSPRPCDTGAGILQSPGVLVCFQCSDMQMLLLAVFSVAQVCSQEETVIPPELTSPSVFLIVRAQRDICTMTNLPNKHFSEHLVR